MSDAVDIAIAKAREYERGYADGVRDATASEKRRIRARLEALLKKCDDSIDFIDEVFHAGH